MSDLDQKELVAAFEECRLEPAAFTHRRHVEVAFTYLLRHGYAGALVEFSRSLKRFAGHWGKHDLYHETITVAFVTLIHERLAQDLATPADGTAPAWDDFAARHPDLFDRRLLADYYSPDVLKSDLARRCFLLPVPGVSAPPPAHNR
jgi:hypothetical protein